MKLRRPGSSSPSTFSAPRRVMAEINVTPLVDVMLVLLVIFIITAPLMASKIKLNLPSAETAKAESAAAAQPVQISINAKGELFLAGKPQVANAGANAGANTASAVGSNQAVNVGQSKGVDQVGGVDQAVSPEQLKTALQATAKFNPDNEVQLRADEKIAYGRVVEVMDLIQSAGLTRIGFVANPKR